MKKLILFSLLVTCLLASCGDDDICVESDFVGTWVGSEDCDTDSLNNVTITIVAQGGILIIDGGMFSTDVVNIENCRLDGKNTNLGLGWEYSGLLKDDVLKLTHGLAGVLLNDEACLYTLTRM